MIDINKPVTNLDLIKSLDNLKTNYTQENQTDFFRKVLEANFLTPALLKRKSHPRKYVSEEDSEIKLVGIINEEGEQFLPAFTDWDELRKWNQDENIQTLILNLKDYEEIILNRGNQKWKGFVMNPRGQNIVFGKNEIELISNFAPQIKKKESVMLGIPKEYPERMVDDLIKLLPSINSVKSAYLLQMIKDGFDKSLLIVIDDDSPNDTFEKIANIATRYLKSNEKIDFVQLNTPFGRDAVVDQKPFYVK